MLIVSNSAGTQNDPELEQAKILQQATGVEVFKHSVMKPGCGPDVFEYLRNIPKIRVEHPSHVAVVGDRLFTDIVMASTMGFWSIWIEVGVVENNGFVSPKTLTAMSNPHAIPVLEVRKETTSISDSRWFRGSHSKN